MKKYNKSIRREAIEVKESMSVVDEKTSTQFNESDLPALCMLLNDPRILIHEFGYEPFSFENRYYKMSIPEYPYIKGSTYNDYEIKEISELLKKICITVCGRVLTFDLWVETDDFFTKNPHLIIDTANSIPHTDNDCMPFLPSKYNDLRRHFEAKKAIGMTIEWFVAWQISYSRDKFCPTGIYYKEAILLIELLAGEHNCDMNTVNYLLEAERNEEIELRVHCIREFDYQALVYRTSDFQDLNICNFFLQKDGVFKRFSVEYTGLEELKVRNLDMGIDMYIGNLSKNASLNENKDLLYAKVKEFESQLKGWEISELSSINEDNLQKYLEVGYPD